MTESLSAFVRVFRGRQRGRLVRHYFLVSVILISGGLLTSGLVEVYFRYQENWEHLALLQQGVAEGAAFKIQQYIQEIELTMKIATRGQEIAPEGTFSEHQLELEQLLVVAPPITEAVAFDAKGIQRAAVSRLRPVLPQIKWDPLTPQAFKQVKQGKSYFGPAYFPRGSEPYMTIATPIERFAGSIIGILRAEIDLKYVWEVISDIHVGKAGRAYLVTRSGDLIAHPDISLVLQKRNLAQLDQVKAAFQLIPGVSKPKALVTRNLQGQKVFSSYAVIHGLGWIVFTEQPVEEFYGPLYASILRTSSLLLVGFGMALLASLLVARRVIGPLNALREGAERTGSGDLDYRVDLKTGDEFEVVAEEFNKMTRSLKELYTELEHKVEERTRALTISNEKLDEASRHKSEFLARVNHELRTPVSAIIGFARLVLRRTEGEISQLQRENLQELLDNAQHLLKLINSLLDLAKIEAGRMEIRVEPVDIDEVIQGALSTVRPMLRQDHVRLHCEIAPGIPTLNTDGDKLRQILLNLLGNAAKFTEEGEIKVSASQRDESLRLVVSDTGIGMEKGELNQIFEEFHQGDMSIPGKYGGTGLGLAIVRKFVNLLGGAISVDSEMGRGSTFTVVLPLDRGESLPD